MLWLSSILQVFLIVTLQDIVNIFLQILQSSEAINQSAEYLINNLALSIWISCSFNKYCNTCWIVLYRKCKFLECCIYFHFHLLCNNFLHKSSCWCCWCYLHHLLSWRISWTRRISTCPNCSPRSRFRYQSSISLSLIIVQT